MARKNKVRSKNVEIKGKVTKPKENPFEIRKQKVKQQVLNSKTRGSTIASVKSRSASETRRNETLGIEYQRKNVNNKFVDRRFSGMDENLPEEEKNLIMFQRAKQRDWDRSSIAELGEEEILTHGGQTLNLNLVEEEDSLDRDELFDEDLPFGGMRKRAGEEDNDLVYKKTKDEVMKEIISKSKKMRNIAKMQKREDEEKIFELDEQFDGIRELLGAPKSRISNPEIKKATGAMEVEGESGSDSGDEEEGSGSGSSESGSEESDSEDSAQPSNKPNKESEEEESGSADEDDVWNDPEVLRIAAKMQDFDTSTAPVKTITQGDIKIVLPETPATPRTLPVAIAEEDDFDRMVREFAMEPRAAPSDPLKTKEDLAIAEMKRLEQLEEARLARMRGDEPVTDLHFESADAVLSKKSKKEEKKKKSLKRPRGADDLSDDFDSDQSVSESESEPEEKETEAPKYVATKVPEILSLGIDEEIPFLMAIPSTFENFLKIIDHQPVARQITIIKRFRKCNHISLNEKNKDLMKIFYQYILQYFLALGMDSPLRMDTLNALTHALFELSHEMPQLAAQTAKAQINRILQTTANGDMPTVSDLLFFSLLLRIWPVSDQRHVVVTPAILLMSKIISTGNMQDLASIITGLFLSHLVITIVKSANRFAPEPFSMLCSVLNAFVDKKSIDPSKFSLASTLPNFNASALKFDNRKEVVKVSKVQTLSFDDIFLVSSTENQSTNRNLDDVRLSILLTTLRMFKSYFVNSQHANLLNGTVPLFTNAATILGVVDKKRVPKVVVNEVSELTKFLDNSIKQVQWKHLRLHEKSQVIVPKMFEPEFQEVYTGKKKNAHLSLQKREEARLKHLRKQEKKGAERELRLDAQYLARKRHEKVKELDADRINKTKQLMGFLETQQHEGKELQKAKKRKTSAF